MMVGVDRGVGIEVGRCVCGYICKGVGGHVIVCEWCTSGCLCAFGPLQTCGQL